MALWVLVVNTWAAGPFNFQYWRWNAQMISAYRWLMASALAPGAAVRLAYTLAVCATIFAAAWFTRDPHSDRVTMRPLFLMAAALFCGAALQKGMVRSGWGHLSQCALPAISLSGAILVGYRNTIRESLSRITLLAAVALTVFFSGPANLFAWEGVAHRVFWKAPPYPACPPGTYYLDQACFLRREYATFGIPSQYIRNHSMPNDAIVVYPYENLFGMISGRRVSAGVLQNYAIGGQSLTNLQISTIERERPPLGVYCADDIVSWPVDGISNFQRTAPVWLYLQNHYMAEAEPVSGVTILRRDDARAANSHIAVHELWRASGPNGQPLAEIDPARWAAYRSDFLRLKVRVEYSPLWKIAKPSSLLAVVQLSDGTSKTSRLAIEPDRMGEIWIYPWQELNLKRYFQADPRNWRPTGQDLPAVRSVQLHAERFDPLSVTPSSIDLAAIDGIELGLGVSDMHQ
jgi:hypothetical protein